MLKALLWIGNNKVRFKYSLDNSLSCFSRSLGQPTNWLLRCTHGLHFIVSNVIYCRKTHTHMIYIYTSRKNRTAPSWPILTLLETAKSVNVRQRVVHWLQLTLQRNFPSKTSCIQFLSLTGVPVSTTSVTAWRSIFGGLCNISFIYVKIIS